MTSHLALAWELEVGLGLVLVLARVAPQQRACELPSRPLALLQAPAAWEQHPAHHRVHLSLPAA